MPKKSRMFENFYSDKLIGTPLSVIYLDDRENIIWFCSQGKGMGYVDITTKEFTFYTEEDGLPSNFVSSLISVDSTFWVSTFKGLVKFDKKSKTFDKLADTHNLPSFQFQPKASVILPNGTLGFGGSKGLVIFNPKQNNATTPKVVGPLKLNAIAFLILIPISKRYKDT